MFEKLKNAVLALLLFVAFSVHGEDGSRLWLRYDPLDDAMKSQLQETIRYVFADLADPTIRLGVEELQAAMAGFTGQPVETTTRIDNHTVVLLTAAYTPDLSLVSEPKYDLRMLNHWDNLDGTIERGYAGYSLWKWDELPDMLSPRYAEYARANASIGINATVPNSVNANPLVLTDAYLHKLKANSEGQPGPMDYGRTHADGTLLPIRVTAKAGVANTGLDANWCGHHFAQANWYAFGRQAWDHEIDSGQIADEWIRLTFTSDSAFLQPVKAMMLESREAAVNYMMPLGLHHLFAWTHHYGPEPWCDIPGAREDWLPRCHYAVLPDLLRAAHPA